MKNTLLLSVALILNTWAQSQLLTDTFILDGPSDDEVRDVITDSMGNIYACGQFAESIDLDPSDSEEIRMAQDDEDAFIVKLSPTGEYLWGDAFGGSDNDWAYRMEVDVQGNLYVCGFVTGNITFQNEQLFLSGSRNIFLIKYDPNGNVLWNKFMGSNGSDQAADLYLEGNTVTIVGNFSNTIFFDPPEFTTSASASDGSEVYCATYQTDGTFISVHHFGGAGLDVGIAMDRNNENTAISGWFREDIDLAPGNEGSTLVAQGDEEGYIACFDNDNLLWSQHLMGSNENDTWVLDVEFDSQGDLLAVGFFTDTLTFENGETLETLGGDDGFLMKIDDAGDIAWVQAIASLDNERIYTVEVDNEDNIYMSGYTEGPMNFNVDGFTETIQTNGRNFFVLKMDPTGTYQWSVFMDSPGFSLSRSFHVIAENQLVMGTTMDDGTVVTPAGTSEISNTDDEAGGIFVLEEITSIEEAFKQAIGNVYPNPSDGWVTLDLDLDFSQATLQIQDATGKRVSESVFSNGENLFFHLPDNSGIYYLNLSIDRFTYSFKVVKE